MKILIISEQKQAFEKMANCFVAEPVHLTWHELSGNGNVSAGNVVNAIIQYLTREGCGAVISDHSPYSLRILSYLAATINVPFYSRLNRSAFPNWTRSICANRLVETVRPPVGAFCATMVINGEESVGQPFILGDELSVQAKHVVDAPMKFEAFRDEFVQLDSARVVFAGGRGLGSKQNFDALAACAKRFGAGLAASRLAVDLGWARSDMQVGQTGRSIAPDTYIMFGISGAVQHIAGIQNARYIYAINTDKSAPIFSFAHAGIVADAMSVIQKMMDIAVS